MQSIPVETGSASYTVFTGSGLLPRLCPRIIRAVGRKPKRMFVVTSPEIWALWSNVFLASFPEGDPPTVLFLPPGEAHKRLAEVERLARELASAGADRSSVLVVFGGGIVGDLGGFLAAIYMRGIDYIQVPTTFLAQVDSSVGGKTGANLPEGKNLIGSFHHPRAVFADIDTLSTLSDRELRAGLYESVKAGIIRDAKLFNYMEKNAASILAREPKALEKVIAASIRMKAEVVGMDERESGLRMILNYGHTIGHAIETATNYRKLLHGEAVAWGMLAASILSMMRGTLTGAQYSRIERTLHLYGTLQPLRLQPDRLIDAAGHDKKNSAGVRRFVLANGIGDASVVENVTEDELYMAIDAMFRAANDFTSQTERD